MSVLAEIHEAVAAVLRDNVDRQINVYAYPEPNGDLPKIEVQPGSPYVGYWESYGADGRASMNLTIRVETNNQDAETAGKVMTDLLSAGGTGEASSIPDALMSDRTLRGTVETCTPIRCEWSTDGESYNHVGFVECLIVFRKQGANA